VFDSADLTSWRADLDLPLSSEAPAAGRHFLHSTLDAWGVPDDELGQDAALVLSELITNAVVHGAGSVRVEFRIDAEHLTLAVRDGSAVLPDRREAGPLDGNGRGLEIIEALAVRWGVDVLDDGGKRVFVELALPPRVRPDATRR
jgi:anti-sigma regulatory factor (Ser/Thr protein kinase)